MVIQCFCRFYSFNRFPDGSVGKEYDCNAGDLGSIPGLGRSPGEGKGNPLQYSGLENSSPLSGLENSIVAKSWTRLSDFHILYLKLLWNIDYIFCAVLEKIKKKMIKNEEEAVGQRGMQRPCSQKELGEIKRLIESWRG